MDDNNRSENNNNTQERGDTFWDDKSLMELFNRTVTLTRRYLHQRLHSHGAQGDPHRGQARVLSILKIKPDISQKDLGYLLDMRSQSLGELLMKLERAGYITRTPSEEDRRVMNIHLTELGESAAGQAEIHRADSGRLFDCLTPEEQTNLSAYLKKLIMRMDAELKEAYETRGMDYDPFWGAADFKDDIKDCCRQYKHDVREQSRALHDHLHEHGHQLRREMRERARDLRDELRRDPRLKGFFWGAGDWGCGPDDFDYDDYRGAETYRETDDRNGGRDGGRGDDRGNGPRPR